MTKEQALQLFDYNPFKCEIINDKVQDNEMCTAYRCGDLIDLCKGPHLPNTSFIKCMQLLKTSSSYWKNNSDKATLQRIYGISFTSEKEQKKWNILQQELAERDHRTIGKKMNLFFFNKQSCGSAFFLPKGMKVYNALVDHIKQCYLRRGFEEVLTPNIYNKNLWEISGHWEHYRENMFCFSCDKTEYALKPMNCPAHCLLFQSQSRSASELPIRYAEFGALHRNELSGALTGLTRVRRFQQDDAHIFLRVDQIEEEIKKCLNFMSEVYSKFGFNFTLELSTRPEKDYMGSLEIWDNAENIMKQALIAFCGDAWKLNAGDGAFYGPKIDVHIKDAIGREHQCATIQLDFNLPERFKLEYNDKGEMKRPVIIHRAIYGSIERFMGIIIEHFKGDLPFWISPNQCKVLTIGQEQEVNEHAGNILMMLKTNGFNCESDLSDHTIQKKIKQAQLDKFHYMIIIGNKEQETLKVNIRSRSKVIGNYNGEEMVEYFNKLIM